MRLEKIFEIERKKAQERIRDLESEHKRQINELLSD